MRVISRQQLQRLAVSTLPIAELEIQSNERREMFELVDSVKSKHHTTHHWHAARQSVQGCSATELHSGAQAFRRQWSSCWKPRSFRKPLGQRFKDCAVRDCLKIARQSSAEGQFVSPCLFCFQDGPSVDDRA